MANVKHLQMTDGTIVDIPVVSGISYLINIKFGSGYNDFHCLQRNGTNITATARTIYKINSRSSIQTVTSLDLDAVMHDGANVFVTYNNQTQVFPVGEDYRTSMYGKMYSAHYNNGMCDILIEMNKDLTVNTIKAYVVPVYGSSVITGGERQSIPTIDYDADNDTCTLDGVDYSFSNGQSFFDNGCRLPQAYIRVTKNGTPHNAVYMPETWFISDANYAPILDTDNRYCSLARFFELHKTDITTTFKIVFIYRVYDSVNNSYLIRVSYNFKNNSATNNTRFGSVSVDFSTYSVNKV